MKNIQFVTYLIIMFMNIGCVSQQRISCIDIRKYQESPWLSSIVKASLDNTGAKVQSIDKITYSIEGSNTTSVGFIVQYLGFPCDGGMASVTYDCEGEELSQYCGFAGCTGLCDLNILSKSSIYEAPITKE